jgi:hypothetical protein
MTIDLNRLPDDPDDDRDTVVADSFTIGSCEHGHGHIAFWHDDEKAPFAVAYFTPASAVAIARALIASVPAQGKA